MSSGLAAAVQNCDKLFVGYTDNSKIFVVVFKGDRGVELPKIFEIRKGAILTILDKGYMIVTVNDLADLMDKFFNKRCGLITSQYPKYLIEEYRKIGKKISVEYID